MKRLLIALMAVVAHAGNPPCEWPPISFDFKTKPDWVVISIPPTDCKYLVQRSVNLVDWNNVAQFDSTNRTLTMHVESKVFFRLQWLPK